MARDWSDVKGEAGLGKGEKNKKVRSQENRKTKCVPQRQVKGSHFRTETEQ